MDINGHLIKISVHEGRLGQQHTGQSLCLDSAYRVRERERESVCVCVCVFVKDRVKM